MGRFLDRRKAKANALLCEPHSAIDAELFPLLAELMNGVTSDGGKTWALRPYSLTMWCEGQQMHFCFQFEQCDEKCFGSFSGPFESLEQVEKALEKEQYSWRKVRK